jgi:heme/copper-type cytochrome/quinol oxidase subunit 2
MLNELNFSFRAKTQYNVSFFDSSSSNVVHLLVWQYWWWSLFFFFTIYYFIVFSDIILFRNTKNKINSLNSLKSNGRWGDLIAGLLPIYWCINILLNSNMILKVLEWQTETNFCTLRIRGKQWYWVYKISIKNKNSLNDCSFFLGNNKLFGLKKNRFFLLDGFFFKKKFINKIKIDCFFFKNSKFLKFDFNRFENIKMNSSFNNLIFLKNKTMSTNFFFFKKNYNVLKKYNRAWLVIQQQPKTQLEFYFKIPYNFENKNNYYRGLNSFAKNNILVKNRLISTDSAIYLPSRKNITVITNSFDVAHSWFVPGLGLKFDCIPGRSTHNSLFITKAGYYFGHCAEVCGRFHHHMPIKIIALNLDHFIYYYNISAANNKKNN